MAGMTKIFMSTETGTTIIDKYRNGSHWLAIGCVPGANATHFVLSFSLAREGRRQWEALRKARFADLPVSRWRVGKTFKGTFS